MENEEEKRGRGRPKKELYSSKTEEFRIRLTKAEKEKLKEKADDFGISMAEYIRVLLRLR